ncbi:SusC/RagA family TonB-linked outer membrane protein [Chitinophaga cymbidii]|uniref:SusC/RagA family TonB-linked outer membrane protein n=1 Tax=Chitinophaga cymbidii TaxID=1096750 RepID=A0A512RLY3_9BACT|nr:TonB-dependent receptor [Chitinophaga cymbidii]GEP96704.1 SusC/RagA family TonB-linked outer membrane protein [Chitinophaga cymbidii]
MRYYYLLFILMLTGTHVFSQQVSVKGTVTGPDKAPVPGVTVLVSGTRTGTTTMANGQYAIQAKAGDTLVFQFIGFETEKVTVGTSPLINVQLSLSNQGLNEVVVLGYGSQRKRDVTAAISTIDVSKLRDVPAANVSRLLQGQAPGVTVKQNSGAPGREFSVVVRGLGSLGAGSRPLYIIDGFPVGTSVGQNLNPNDIATVTILKDAVSTAIYGARGSNGVVLITTKNAQEGKNSMMISANYGIQNIPESRKTKVLNGPDFAQFKKDIFMDKIRYFEHREPSLDEVPLDFRYPEQTKYSTNWYEEILQQNASFQDYNVTFSGGKGDIRSLVSLGYISQEGALINTSFKNYSVRANIGGKINSFINMGLNTNISYSKENAYITEGRDNLVGAALLLDPREPVYNEDGSYNSYIGGHDGVFGFFNPVQFLNEVERGDESGDILSSGFVEFSFLRHFKFKTALNARLKYDSYKQFVPSTIAGINAPPPRDASEADNSYRTINLASDQLLTYDNNFGQHHVDVLAGFTAQEETVKGIDGGGSQFPDDLTPYLSNATLKTVSTTEYSWSMIAFFGRLNYSFRDRYLFSATFRREGSSRFGSANRYGSFPAVSVGWRLSDEPFMPEMPWLNDLKLRASWGVTGNNDIGNYTSLPLMALNNYILNNNFVGGKVISAFANPELRWERSKQLDVGLDLSAFDGKLNFTAEYYNRITSDMLLPIQLPAIAGFTTTWSNVGKVRNRGVELGIDYRTRIGEVGFNGNFNISFNRNKVLEIQGANDEIWNGTMYGDYNVSKPGRPIGMIYGYKVLGIFQNQAEIDASPTQDGAIPGVYKYEDVNGDGVVSYDQTDMVEIGNPYPKFNWGLTLGADYKNFDLSVLLLGAQKYDLFRQIESSTMNLDGVFNVGVESKERWRSESNPGAGKIGTTNTWKWSRESNSRYIYDASHMWIKNVSLGYTIPKSTLGFSQVRLYLSTDNLFLITNYPGNNPDVDNNGGTNPGLDDEAYPVPRTFSIGANLSF